MSIILFLLAISLSIVSKCFLTRLLASIRKSLIMGLCLGVIPVDH